MTAKSVAVNLMAEYQKRGTEHGSRLGKTRWYVERTLSWLHQYGRLRVRWDRLPEVQRGWMALICLRLLL